MEREERFMRAALDEAHAAALAGEVPIGAVVVYEDRIIAAAHNRRERDKCATAHAEILAIEEACRSRGGWRLFGCELYVTLEPCTMCAGAAINARLDRVIYGASDLRFGAMGSLFDANAQGLNHKLEVTSGILAEESRELLKEFFREKRNNKADLGETQDGTE